MIIANFTKTQKCLTVESLTQGDYGQKLSISGLGLTFTVEVHFAVVGENEGIKMYGHTQAGTTIVEIPNILLAKGKDLMAYIFVCDSQEGKTVRYIRIPVNPKPNIEEIELPPDDQEIVRELITVVNGFEKEIKELEEKKAEKSMIGSPLTAKAIGDMRDTNRIYVYVGMDTYDFIRGNWYYYDGDQWVSGGVYNSVALGNESVTTEKLADYAVTPEKLDRFYQEKALKKTTGTFFDLSKETQKVVIGYENKIAGDHLYVCRKNIWNLKKQEGALQGKDPIVRSQIWYSVSTEGVISLRGWWWEDPVYIPLGIEYQAEMLLGKKVHVDMFDVRGGIPYGISFHMGMNVSGNSVLSNHTVMRRIGKVQEIINEEGQLCLCIEKGLDLQQEIGIGLLCEIISDDSEVSWEFTNGEKKEILYQKIVAPDKKTWIFTTNGSSIYKAIPEDEQTPEFILLKSEAGTTFRIRVTDAGELSIEADR